MQSMKNAHDAIFTGRDEIAAGIIMKAKRLRIRIPKDCGGMEFDNQESTMIMHPNITAIKTTIKSMAKNTIVLLHKQLRGENI
ncbi:substrate-binding domain-containing protein, partial [Bacillus pseudomycoides]|uniref:substrate-binding domain-containing protein n=1 Tax=Bacillus pseudomycoides TaxID=64104 RepID=UPI002852D6A9